jgi:hypothetical protein
MVPFPLIVYGHRKDQLKYLSGGPSAKLMYTAYFIMRVLRIMCSAERNPKENYGRKIQQSRLNFLLLLF